MAFVDRVAAAAGMQWRPWLTWDDIDHLRRLTNAQSASGLGANCDLIAVRHGDRFTLSDGVRNSFECELGKLGLLICAPKTLARPWLTADDLREIREWLADDFAHCDEKVIIDRSGISFSVDWDGDEGRIVFACPGREDFTIEVDDLVSLLLDPRGEQSPPPPNPAPLEVIAHDHIGSSLFLELLDLQSQLRECFIGENMGEAAICLLVGLLSEQNVFLGGPPGTGKTSIVKALGDAIDVPFRKRLAGMETTSRDLFGPIDAKKYADGIAYQRMTENTFSDAKISFLDEGFKASKQALQLLLDYYEDGEIDNGSGRLQTPHRFGVIASNELAPKGSEALLDRFPIRCWGEKVLNQNEEELLLRRSVGMAPKPTITARLAADDLETLRRMALDVRVSDEAFAAVQCWVEMARNASVYVSARQVTGLLPILRAYAFLSGAGSVLPMHVAFLRFVGWSSHDQRKAVGQAAATAAKGIEKTVEYTL
jgi:MoxR-like ATPase